MKIKLTEKNIIRGLPRTYNISEKKVISVVIKDKENIKTFFI